MDCATYPCSGNMTGAAGQMFTMLLQTVLAAPCDLSNPDRWPKDIGEHLDKGSDRRRIHINLEYDFIVIGAGSAGSVIAHRLSEYTTWNVLLIEAGGDPPITTEIPALFRDLMKTNVDWEYYTEPSHFSCMGFKKRRCYLPRGKMLGGTSSMNDMIYDRGNRKDYDTWEKMGNSGWSYDDILKYFKKSEDMRAPQVLEVDKEIYHGTGGELKVDNYYDQLPLKDVIFEAAREMGYQNVSGINDENIIGYTLLQGTLDHGTRCSSAKAFLTRGQKGLHVLKNTIVKKILIDQYNKAIGVRFVRNGKIYEIRSTKEIIVSSGSINSPQLLMLSGIGPRDHLEELGITVRADLPVGKNLQDHSHVPLWITINRDNAKEIFVQETVDQIYDYFTHHSGPFAGIGISNAAIFINAFDKYATYPNAMLTFDFCAKNDTKKIKDYINSFGFIDEAAESLINANRESDILIMFLTVLNPVSLGEIRLKSDNYSDAPLIYGNYYSHPTDVRVALNIIRFCNFFLRKESMKKHQPGFIYVDFPNCRKYQLFSENYWRCYIRNTGSTRFHPAGTVKMGPFYDPTSVVDARLRVVGITGLRVAGASIMPKIVSGNINAATIMIGEKAADLIKEDWLSWF